ncbi:hypothetical protein ACFO4L_05805 [Bacillus daqingensis]|uniref:ATP-binding protein n=1 Tax=Bacillus daqingensis TaxID=872396 RepID=A0ABV9NRY2_9BACI
MKVYGLHGKSGTGKSHRATEIAEQTGAAAIIDDGLLIREGRRLAGRSAKNEQLLLAAVKRAVFHAEAHRDEVKQALAEHQLHSLLVIGTSKRMVRTIVRALDLPEPSEWIAIQDVQSEDETLYAGQQRNRNLHVIPVLPEEAGTAFAGSWFRKLLIRLRRRDQEVLVVKPVYTGKDRIVISPKCLKDMTRIHEQPGIRLDQIQTGFEQIAVQISTSPEITIADIASWKKHLEQAVRTQLGMICTVHIKWKKIMIDHA